jgi:hypothetical protein
MVDRLDLAVIRTFDEHNAAIGLAQRSDEARRRVLRMVVDDDEFPIAHCLRLDAPHGLFDEGRTILDGHDQGQEGHSKSSGLVADFTRPTAFPQARPR